MVGLTDTDTDEEFNIDEAVPANRGLWVSVVYPGTKECCSVGCFYVHV